MLISLKHRQLAFSLIIALTSFLAPANAQQNMAPTPLRIDATAPIPPAGPADFEGGASRSPSGQTIGTTNRYLTFNGEPWLPVMGEFHYSRVPEAEWEDDILKMKAAGVNIVSTYIIWIHHEEVKGVWDWTGQRDLRHFAALCQKHSMLLYPRIGPWAHGEARNGGLPDWVVSAGPIRQLDPIFMSETAELYRQTGAQLKGMMWKDGGPVIGVQIENEYTDYGPLGGEPYLLALKKLAIESGFDVPLYTVTGWDKAAVPMRAFLPVYGGYPDAPWGDSLTALPPQEVYAFRFKSRISGNMGMIGSDPSGSSPQATTGAPRTPFLTAEIGGGIEDTYHRRPVVSPDDIAAMMPVMLGSGVNLYGSYMFQGGENPDGKLTTLQESQATHYPTDVPEKSYDFQAPISAFGLERRSLRVLKEWNYFLNDFGALVAPMPAYAPSVLPTSPTDLSALRFSVRTDGQQGFLFVNNYVRGAAMPARPNTQFAIELPSGTLRIPTRPVDVPSGAYFAWPFRLDLGGVPLHYATAQLVSRLETADGPTFVFACVREVRCEVALDQAPGMDVQTPPGMRAAISEGVTIVTAVSPPEHKEPLRVRLVGQKQVSLLLLSPGEAEDAWKVRLGGEERLLITHADVFTDDTSDAERVTLRSLDSATFAFTLYPAMKTVLGASAPLKQMGASTYTAHLPEVAFHVGAQPVRPAGQAPPVLAGLPLPWRLRGVATAPGSGTWAADAARWALHVSPLQVPPGISDLFLRVDYTGDAAHLTVAGKLLDDNFFNGEPWLVGLTRFSPAGHLPTLQLEVLPMRSDAPVYLEAEARRRIATTGQTVALRRVTIMTQYQLHISSGEIVPANRLP